MALTKRRIAQLTIILTVVFFAAFLFLPDSIVGERRDDIAMFVSKVVFMAIAASLGTSLTAIFIFKRSFFTGQIHTFKKYKYYLAQLVKRDFVSRYRKSVLGVLWSVLNPLLTMLVMTLVFSRVFRIEIENYPVYYLSGSVMFLFFSDSTTMAMGSIIANEGVIKKVYVPKYVFPLSKMLSSLVNLGFSLIAFLLVFTFTGSEFHLTMLLFPIPMIYLFVFALGVGMFMSSMVVFFRDLSYLYGVLLTLWMFMTPIMYPIENIPAWVRPYYGFNPLYQFVNYFRELVLWNNIPGLWDNLVCLALASFSLCLGTYVFMIRQDRYILYL